MTDSDLSVEFAFGRFTIRPAERRLLVDGKAVVLKGRAFDLLLALVGRSDRVVTKNELLELVWPGRVVEENNLQVQISMLRRILGSETIATVPGRGYRFTAVPEGRRRVVTPAPAAAALEDLPDGNLPPELPPLYGRNDAVVALARLLERHRVVSVVGPGGIGKTRVALAVAHGLRGDYPDGVWLVELAPLADPLLLVPTVARVLGHALSPKEAALASLMEAMQEQHLLLVLDNCEHLLGAIAELVAAIALRAPSVRILVTSQEPMHLPEEQVDRLGALAVPTVADVASAPNYGAVELFVARAAAADPRFTLNGDNVSTVVEICRHLDGIALAIELAAARVPLLGVQGVRRRLDERLKLLAGRARGALPRHQTLRAALEWSYSLLSAEECSVFDRLGVFVGSFSLEAAQYVASDDSIDAWAVLDHLATLVDKSLVLVEGGDPPRYRLLESSRAFALEHLERADTSEGLRRRHAMAIIETLRSSGRREGLTGRMNRIGPDLDNVRAAVAWAAGSTGDRLIAIALLGGTVLLWDAQGCGDEGTRWFRTVEPWVDESTPPKLAAHFWYAYADLRIFFGMQRKADAALRAVELFRKLGDQRRLYSALLYASLNLSFLSERSAAEAALVEAQTLLDPTWPPRLFAVLELHRGIWMYCCGVDTVKDVCTKITGVIEKLRASGGEDFLEHIASAQLFLCDYALGDLDGALRRAREIFANPIVLVTSSMQSLVSPTLGGVFTALGRLQEAEATLKDAVRRLRRTAGSAAYLAFSDVSYLVARQGRIRDAARLIGYVDKTHSDELIWHTVPHLQRSYDLALARIREGLAPDELDRLRSAGRELTEDMATRLAFPVGQAEDA